MAVKVAIAIAHIEKLYGPTGRNSVFRKRACPSIRIEGRHEQMRGGYQCKTSEIQTKRLVRTAPRLISFSISCRPPS